MVQDDDAYEVAAREAVELANRLAEIDREADLWDIADGMIAGAVHYWLYSRQPCGDPSCEDCNAVSTAEERMRELHRMIDDYAKESEYFHTPHDSNVGRA